MERHLDWPGAFNVRDLGGLDVVGGGCTARGALVRGDSLQRLTGGGWEALLGYGVRTVIDLRNEDECGSDEVPRPAALKTHRLPLDDIEARDFWGGEWESGPQFATPLYYRAHILRFPERSARVLSAIARADPGGVVVHCGVGRDRTGLISMLVLALVGVDARAIAEDYELSHERLSALNASLGQEDEAPILRAFLEERRSSAAEIIATTLGSIDLESELRTGGLTADDLGRLRGRLLAQ
jgi:protein-tyrosine phosphatase